MTNTKTPDSQSKRESFEMVFRRDEESIEKIIGIAQKSKQKSAINSHIAQILEDFKASQKTKEDFDQMMKRLVVIKMNGAVYSKEGGEEREEHVGEYLFNADRAWSQEQVDEIIEFFEQFEPEKMPEGGFNDYHEHYFWEMFTTSNKKGKEQTTISDLVAKYLAKRIDRGGKVPEPLQAEVRGWCQNIQMIDSDVRLDFLSAILNNPGKVSGHTVSEAIGHMGLYGPGFIRQLEGNLEKNKKNIGKALKVITILNHLRHLGDQTGFEDSGDEAFKLLEEVREGANNYFIKTKAAQVLRRPLEDYTVKEKRLFLKGDWRNIMRPEHFYDTIAPVLGESDPYEIMDIDPTDESILMDEEIEDIFERYGYVADSYYYWNEREQMKDRHEDDDLRKSYNIIPSSAENEYYKDKITRESCYTRVNNKYGAIYTSGGQVDSFFQLDAESEKQAQEEREKNGEIPEGTLEFFVNKFDKAEVSGDSEQFLYYLQIRGKLPKKIKERIDSRLGLEIPKELDRNFASKTEFDGELERYKERLLEDLSSSQAEKVGFLRGELNTELHRRKDAAKEKYFGFASEDIELLDFFNSFNMQHPNRVHPTAHHTICYYLYLRKDLPEDLTREFEEKFDVRVPEKLKEFGTFDDYLATSDRELLMPFTHYPNFQEMSTWLNQRIGGLSQRIKETKNTPERLSIAEILEKEGFKKEDMSEEEYDKLLLTYKTLIELPIRERMEKDFGIKLEDYSVREQVQFVNFLSTKTIEEVERVKGFLNEGDNELSRKHRVKAFLSLESGQFTGDDIILIGESLKDDSKLVNKLFEVYASLVDQTAITKDELREMFRNQKEVKDEEVGKVSRMILNKANELLLDYVRMIKEGKEISKVELLNELEGYKAELVLTASVWKSVDKSGLSFEDLEGVTFEVDSIGRITGDGKIMSLVDEISKKETDDKNPFIPGANIRGAVSRYALEASQEERQKAQEILEMIDIYRKNYIHKPKLQKKIVEGFIDKLRTAGDQTLVYSFKKEGHVLAFNRFDQMDGNRKYFGSFNVEPSLAGSAIGTALMQASLDREASQNDIEADCDPETAIGSYYVEKAGFVVYSVVPNYGGTGETIFTIERKPQNKEFNYRNMSNDELMLEYERRFRGNVYRQGSTRMVLKFEKDSNELFESSERLVNKEGYIMTRYFFDKGGKEVYCAFERGGN